MADYPTTEELVEILLDHYFNKKEGKEPPLKFKSKKTKQIEELLEHHQLTDFNDFRHILINSHLFDEMTMDHTTGKLIFTTTTGRIVLSELTAEGGTVESVTKDNVVTGERVLSYQEVYKVFLEHSL